jgi:hypothetical protein
MANTAKGRYRYNSAWSFKGGRNSGRSMFMRTNECKTARNNPTMWLDYFFGADGIAGHRAWVYRRGAWETLDVINVHWF